MNAVLAAEARNDIANYLVNDYVGSTDHEVEIISNMVETAALNDGWYKVAPSIEASYSERVQLSKSIGGKSWIENVRNEDVVMPLIKMGWRATTEHPEGWRLSK